MVEQKPLCNGAATGRSCKHYWVHVEKVESQNPDFLRLGMTLRGCGWHPSIFAEMETHELAVRCNRYEPRPKTWRSRLRLAPDHGAYDPTYEEYRPLTPEEIKARDAEHITVEQGVERATAGLVQELTADQALEGLFQDEDDK